MEMMSNFTNNLGKKGGSMFSSSKFWIITGLAVLFIGIAFWIYQYYILPRLEPTFVSNAEIDTLKDDGGANGGPGAADANGNLRNYAEIYFFHTDWCPYSQEAMPIWKDMKRKMNNKKINKHTLLFKEIDGEKDSAKMADFEDEYKKKIDGFPTIMLVKENQVVDYEAEVNRENLNEFINSVL